MVARSFRYSCLVLVAIETNLSDLWAAFSALMIFVRRNLVKAEFLENRAEAGMGGPNIGTFFDLVTAILKQQSVSQFDPHCVLSRNTTYKHQPGPKIS